MYPQANPITINPIMRIFSFCVTANPHDPKQACFAITANPHKIFNEDFYFYDYGESAHGESA